MTASAVPLVVICHDNHRYVDSTIVQAAKFGLRVIVLDNASTYAATRSYLKSAERVVEVKYLGENFGYSCWSQPSIYAGLPDRFFLSDPDLQWNARLPSDFPAILERLFSELDASQVGFALDLSDAGAMFQDADYFEGRSIPDWESQFWATRLAHPSYELYRAPIDTTFHFLDKAHRSGPQVRVAGDFSAKHLPWYRDTTISPHDRLHMYVGNHGATARLVLREMERTRVFRDAIDACKHECRDDTFLASAKSVKKEISRQLEAADRGR